MSEHVLASGIADMKPSTDGMCALKFSLDHRDGGHVLLISLKSHESNECMGEDEESISIRMNQASMHCEIRAVGDGLVWELIDELDQFVRQLKKARKAQMT